MSLEGVLSCTLLRGSVDGKCWALIRYEHNAFWRAKRAVQFLRISRTTLRNFSSTRTHIAYGAKALWGEHNQIAFLNCIPFSIVSFPPHMS